MAQMVLGIMPNREHANMAIDDLQERGYNPKDMSIIVKDGENEDITTTTGAGEKVATGTVTGATTGGIVGALAGLLVGVGALAIPGFGAVLIAGPIAAALGLTGAAATTVSGAITGILAGGLVGALVNLGVPEREAKIYEEKLKQGSVLLGVPVEAQNRDEVMSILKNHFADQVSTVNINL